MSNSTVSDIPDRTDPRRTMTQCSASLWIWADQHRRRAPELAWQEFDELVGELKAAVPGTGPVKDEIAYYRAHNILKMMLTHLYHSEKDMAEEAFVLETAIEQLDKAIEF